MKLEPKKIFVGLSATPWAAGMAHHWDDLLIPATIKEMIALGHLCSCKTFAPTKPDLSGVRVEKGDYVEHELSDLMGQKAIIADVVATWLDRAQGLPTMVFAVDRAHAAKLTAEFASVGVRAAYVDALTAREERLAVKKLFATGDVQVICSVGTMTHGVDMDVRCISFCRPTKSPILYVQAVGRGLRTAPDKQHLLLLDHSNATLELGLVTDIGFSKLRGGNKEEKAKGSSKPMALLRPKECSRCGELVPAMVAKCEGCGYVMRVFSDVTTLDGELSEYDGTDSVKVQQMRSETRKAYTRPEKINFYAQLKWFGESKGYAEGWASHKYVEMFGCWPRDDSVPRATEPVKPHPTVLAWIRRRNLAWIHGKRRAQNAG
jgi:superfamily II DNA or RNA helicase